ncbi:MAG: hypothetical protein WBV11_04805 [Salegentibacter sp.]
MKSWKFLFLALAIGFSSLVSANNSDPKSGNPDGIARELQSMLNGPDMVIHQDLKAEVAFTVNKDNEVVVLSVDSDNEYVKEFVMKRLNYKKLQTKVDGGLVEYNLPVRIQP